MDQNFYPLFEDFLDNLRKNGIPIIEAATAEQIRDIPRLSEQEAAVSPYTGKTINVKKVADEIEKAKYYIIRQSALYRPYVHDMSPVIYTWIVPTMATDGIRLFINPEFAANLPWLGKIFVIIHEIMHCILMHDKRGEGTDHELFNIAADYEINALIVDTTDDFDEKFVKDEIKGLYEKKYLSIPVEQIYQDLLKNPPPKQPGQPQPGTIKIDPTKKAPKGGTPPPPGGPKQPPQDAEIELKPGVKVRIKSTGKAGVITKVNKDGTYEVDPINESLIMPKLITEGYKKEELVPILPPGSGGSGGDGQQVNIKGEYETEKGEKGEKGEGSGKGEKGKDGKGKPSSAAGMTPDQIGLHKKLEKGDRGNAGGIIDKRTGEQIAAAEGYDPEEARAGDDARAKWESNAKEIAKSAEKLKEAGSGRGEALINRIGKILKSSSNWRSILKAYVGSALSPEKEYRIGAKKHLYKSDEYLRRGLRVKKDALKRVVVCVDVSGSIFSGSGGSATFEKIIAEINAIIFSKKIKEITVIFFDDGVDKGSIQVIKPKTTNVWIPKNVKGGGGTNFQKPLDWIHHEYKDAINLCIFLTDGFASNPATPKYAHKFIWIVYDNFDYQQPFGKIIKTSSGDM